MKFFKFFRHGLPPVDQTQEVEWAWMLIDAHTDLTTLREKFGNKDIYLTVQSYDESQVSAVQGDGETKYNLLSQTSPYVMPFFFDLDNARLDVARNDAAKVVDFLISECLIPESLIHIYFSGKKGFHIIIDHGTLGLGARNDWHNIYSLMTQNIADYLDLKSYDKSVYTCKRVLRIPDSIHIDTGLYKVEVNREELDLPVEGIKALAKTHRGRIKGYDTPAEVSHMRRYIEEYIAQYEADKSNRSIKDTTDLSPLIAKNPPPVCIQDLLERGIWVSGDRNKATLILAAYYKCLGKPKEKAAADVYSWASKIPAQYTSTPPGRKLKINTHSVVDSVYSEPEYTFKCPFILSLGTKSNRLSCNKDECPLHESNIIKSQPATELSLGDANHPQNYGKKIRTRILIASTPQQPMIMPVNIRFSCRSQSDCKNEGCMLFSGKAHSRKLDAGDKQVLALCVAPDNQKKTILSGFLNSNGCKNVIMEFVDIQTVYDVYACPSIGHNVTKDIGSEIEKSQYASMMVYFMSPEAPEVNKNYAVEGFLFAHPKDNRACLVVDRFDKENSELDDFKLNEARLAEFKVQRSPEHTAQAIYKKALQISDSLATGYLGMYDRSEMMLAVLLTYHSVLHFKFLGTTIQRGWMNILLMGDSGEGKSKIVYEFMKHVGLGDFASGESSKRTGLTYGIKQVNSQYMLQWGRLILQDRQLLAIDEASEISEYELGLMTAARSHGLMEVNQVVFGKAYCRTRLIFMSNPRSRRHVGLMSYSIDAVNDIFDSPADVRRLDLAVIVQKDQVDNRETNKKVNVKDKDLTYTPEMCRNSVLWAWTRNADQVIITDEAETAILDLSLKLWDRYQHETIELISKNDTKEKMVRMAVALAAIVKCTTDDGEKIIVTPQVAEAVYLYIQELYDTYSLNVAAAARKDSEREIKIDRTPGETRLELERRKGHIAYQSFYKICKVIFKDDYDTIKSFVGVLNHADAISVADANTLMFTTDKAQISKVFKELLNAGFIRPANKAGKKDNYERLPKLSLALRYHIEKSLGISPKYTQPETTPSVKVAVDPVEELDLE